MIQIVCCDACHEPVHITTGNPAVQAWEDGRGWYYHFSCYKPSEPPTAPGLRPLHIEDGQVQEDVTLKSLQGHVLQYGDMPHQARMTSVPEAEPPEQDTGPLFRDAFVFEEHEGPVGTVSLPQNHGSVKNPSSAFWVAMANLELATICQHELDEYGHKCTHYQQKGLVEARQSLIAAAHREYAQPDTPPKSCSYGCDELMRHVDCPAHYRGPSPE